MQVAKILEEEKKLRQKVIRGNWSIVKDKAQQMTNMEKVANYGEAFAAIQEATGISDIDELVTSFIHAEDENFRLFRCVRCRVFSVTRPRDVRRPCAVRLVEAGQR